MPLLTLIYPPAFPVPFPFCPMSLYSFCQARHQHRTMEEIEMTPGQVAQVASLITARTLRQVELQRTCKTLQAGGGVATEGGGLSPVGALLAEGGGTEIKALWVPSTKTGGLLRSLAGDLSLDKKQPSIWAG